MNIPLILSILALTFITNMSIVVMNNYTETLGIISKDIDIIKEKSYFVGCAYTGESINKCKIKAKEFANDQN